MTALGEFMTKDVHVVGVDDIVADAAEAMVRGRFGSVCVMTGSTLVGILTERDVLRAAAERADMGQIRVRDWMTPDPVTATADVDSSDAAQTMVSQGFRHLPVADDAGALIGIVSLRDLLSARIGLGR